MNRVRPTSAIVLAALLSAACAYDRPTPYAERYAQALERYPGEATAGDQQIDRFVRFFSHQGHDALSARDLYAPALYFSDTLLTSEDFDAVVAHLERMRRGAGDLTVQLLNSHVEGQDVYLTWRMQARFTPVHRVVLSDTVGVTHLRFNADGLIVLHQDFWDSAEGFYQHLPVIGTLIRTVARRFASHAP
jgi:hypothetical protein